MTSAEDVRLTEQEIDQARLAFLKFDTDGSGSIDQACLRFSFLFFFEMHKFSFFITPTELGLGLVFPSPFL